MKFFQDLPIAEQQEGSAGDENALLRLMTNFGSGLLEFLSIGSGQKSFKVDRTGGWAGAVKFDDAPFSFDMLGNVIVNSITINGLSGSTIAGAIDENGDFVNELISDSFNTSTQRILGEYQFQGSGAIAVKTDDNNGLWFSPSGILVKKSGATKFSVDDSGNVTFAGTMIGASGTFGTVTAGTLQGVALISKAITSSSGRSVKIDGDTSKNVKFYYNDDEVAYFQTYIKGTVGSDYEVFRIAVETGRRIEFHESYIGFDGDILPEDDNEFTLGSYSKRWSDLIIEDIHVDDLVINSNGSISIPSSASITVDGSGADWGTFEDRDGNTITVKEGIIVGGI